MKNEDIRVAIGVYDRTIESSKHVLTSSKGQERCEKECGVIKTVVVVVVVKHEHDFSFIQPVVSYYYH